MAKNAAVKVEEKPTTSTLAIISVLAGFLGLVGYPFLPSIAAIVTGIMANREIAASQGRLTGREVALAGQILGWIGVGVGFLMFCAFCMFMLVFLALISSGAPDQELLMGLGLLGSL